MIYRFRVAYEEHEDVYRDIDIKASQTFNDLHYIIQQVISFDNSKSYSFFVSDDYWRRELEIPLDSKHDEKEKKNRSKKDEPPPKRKVIADYVNSPHQKFIYLFDPEKEWIFLIELIKILPAEDKAYPVCAKSVGTSPKQYKETNLPPPPPEEEDELKKEKEELPATLIEKDSSEEEEGFIPLDGESIEDISDLNIKEADEDAEEPAAEEEEGESPEGFESDDEETL